MCPYSASTQPLSRRTPCLAHFSVFPIPNPPFISILFTKMWMTGVLQDQEWKLCHTACISTPQPSPHSTHPTLGIPWSGANGWAGAKAYNFLSSIALCLIRLGSQVYLTWPQLLVVTPSSALDINWAQRAQRLDSFRDEPMLTELKPTCIVDYAMQYPVVVLLHKEISKKITRELVLFFSHKGLPKELLFLWVIFLSDVCWLLQIKQIHTCISYTNWNSGGAL